MGEFCGGSRRSLGKKLRYSGKRQNPSSELKYNVVKSIDYQLWSTSTTRTNHTASHTTSHTTNHTAFLKPLGGGNGLLYDFSRSKSDLYNIWTCTDVAVATDLLYEPHRASMSLIDKSVKWRRVTANHTAIIQLLTLSRFHRVIYYVFSSFHNISDAWPSLSACVDSCVFLNYYIWYIH